MIMMQKNGGRCRMSCIHLLVFLTVVMFVVDGFTIPKSLTRTQQSTFIIQPKPTPPTRHHPITTSSRLDMMDLMFSSDIMIDPSTSLSSVEALFSSTNLLAFTDQGQNLAGIFFQASLIPYLLFLYFLSFRANRISPLGNFGFQYVLLFVLSTIPSGIISKSVYGYSLANTDWLHGSAETLLTVANILIVLGFREAMTNPNPEPFSITDKKVLVPLGIVGAFALTCFLGTNILEGHAQFLAGLGNLPTDITQNLPWVTHTEPENALSVPTWAIHFSSVFEWLFAMNLVWRYAETTQNEKWKGLTWGMFPLHASGLCACTYHFFYNPTSLQFLVTSQAGLTLLGNITLMIAAYRIAVSNGWNIQDEVRLLPFLPRSKTSTAGLVADGLAAMPLKASPEAVESNQILTAKIVTLTLLASYFVKYGELGLDLPFSANPAAAVGIILGVPSITGFYYYQKSKQTSDDEQQSGFSNFQLPSFLTGGDGNKPSLSMSDVKKFGIAGTVAYVLTELAFWIVAFPVAAAALYQSTGHWPDVINDNTDRAAVLAFIFAGANIARAFVPIRLGAALALAPWVDENIISKLSKEKAESEPEVSK